MPIAAEVNFVEAGLDDAYVEQVMGPMTPTDGPFIRYTRAELPSMAHIMARVELHSSISEARRNGWNKPVPDGYSDIVVGKGPRRVRIYILQDVLSVESVI